MSFHFATSQRRSLALWLMALTAAVVCCEPLAMAQETKERPGRARRARDREEGFTPLLKGDGTEIWKGYNKQEWPEGWKLEDGVLHRHAGGGDLATKQEYGDFDLRFGFKFSPGGNSGVMYRVTEADEPAYLTGPEYQVLDDAKHKDGQSPLTSSGSLYALYPPSEKALKPAGEWNRGRIVLRGNRVQHFLNGKKVVDAEIGSDDWNEKLASSKFATWPKFAKNQKGKIVLQDHGDEVWFRNMRIKELTGKPESK